MIRWLAVALTLVSTLALGRPSDWTRFGYHADRRNAGPRSTTLTPANVGTLVLQQIDLGGTADSSPIYLGGVLVGGASHDVFVVTTSYGVAVAVDAASGAILWRFTPSGYASLAGTAQITNSSPVADPSRRFVYSASPDGCIHKLALADGSEAAGWPVAVTRDATHEKIGTSLNLARGLVLVGTGGYVGDAPPYQGHVAAIDARSGRLVHVWNSLCSDRSGLIDPPSCPESDSAIWARAGVVVDPASGDLLVATGNGAFDGVRYWGDSVLALSPDASRLLRNWTPTNQAELDSGDVDLGSTAPALLGHGLAVQGGKDGLIRVLSLARLNGTTRAGPRTGGALQSIAAPGGAGVFTAPAVWRSEGKTWLFVADASGTGAYTLAGRGLVSAWQDAAPGTSPVVAGGILWVYDASGGGLRARNPTTGAVLATLPAGPGHWSSPIVTAGRIALPEGDANAHETSGVLDVWRLP